MKKFFKYIIISFCMIICLCSIIVPTYCLTIPPVDTYTITNGTYYNPQYSNYYNNNNLQYVNIVDFNLSRTNNKAVCQFTCPTLIPELKALSNTTYVDIQDLYISHYGTKYKIGTLSVTYLFSYSSSNAFVIYQKSFNFQKVEFSVPLDLYDEEWNYISLTIPHLPYYYIFQYVDFIPSTLIINNLWQFDYSLDYNSQYFYNDFFGVAISRNWPLKTLQYNSTNWVKRKIVLTDNNDVVFSSEFTDARALYNEGIYFENNFNFESSYIKNIGYYDTCANLIFNNLTDYYFEDDFYFSDRIYFNNPNWEHTPENDCMTIYSGNSKDYNGLSSSLIPLGSNEFYKSGEWYDIPTHLYNFFIYLIFDAPIISNFTRLIMIIINFIFEMFTFLISLFDGFESVFFISIFVGFIVLIFLLKIIFKG